MKNISELEYNKFIALIYEEIGITLSENKQALLESRFYKRMIHYGLDSYSEYYDLCLKEYTEKIEMLNLITTNETYFFREEEHFKFLKEYLIGYSNTTKVKVWSAASSVGAEAYSIAMLCDSIVPANQWEVLGTDINSHVIKKARMRLYQLSWSLKIPQELRHKYCLRGKGKYEGMFLINRELARNVKFQTNNLLEYNKDLGTFDIVFLRNVLIYFDKETRQIVIQNIVKNMKVGSYLIISQTENLNGLNIIELEQVQSSIFRKVLQREEKICLTN
ncbi:protein-glutamate O-methyltransferase CheR [Sulfurimonas sp. SAG-AH-194-C21]|nr:protein-glutamate O-methyltransferase CheR [Sulfurimonas sp. SAG-AH-194-C21]MDF1884057.1 protein-glutamate O-methyltransferase CheR [Sulfurimonas sp. SAG-AH-194-C21]